MFAWSSLTICKENGIAYDNQELGSKLINEV